MKNLYKTGLWSAFLIIIFATLSCNEDFLTKDPEGLAAGPVMYSPDGVESLLIATYGAMDGTSIFGGSMVSDWLYGSACSDDCYRGTSAGTNILPIDRYYINSSNIYYLRDRWKDCFNGVSHANLTLESLNQNKHSETPLSEERAKQIEGESKFLRAWFHFQLNKVFENIPYIKTADELAPGLPENVSNHDPAWDEIEADLRFAIEALPDYHPLGQVGRANRFAAEAVKAQAHMYQAEYEEARVLLDDILFNGNYILTGNFYDNFDIIHENNTESIFEVQSSTFTNSYRSVYPAGAAFHQKGPASCGGWGFFNPTQGLFEAYQVGSDGLPVININDRDALVNDQGPTSMKPFIPTDHLLDPRVDWTIARRGIDFLGWGIHPGNNWIREQDWSGPFMTKKYMHFKSEQQTITGGSSFHNGKNFRLYRLTHIILWRAEVAVEQGDPELARTLVNLIRNRAKNSNYVMGLCTSYSNLESNPVVDWSLPAANYLVEPYPAGHPAFSSKEKAREAVRMEMRLELATEGHRFFDLRRWGIDSLVLNDFIMRDQVTTITMKDTYYNPEEDDYWPLPPDQVSLQKGVLKQDSSYLTSKF